MYFLFEEKSGRRHFKQPYVYFLRLVLLLICLLPAVIHSKTNDITKMESLVDQFYKMRNGTLFWYTEHAGDDLLRQELILQIEQCDQKGLSTSNYDLPGLKDKLHLKDASASGRQAADRLYTEQALQLIQDLLIGAPTCPLSYDELSPKYIAVDNKFKLDILNTCTDFRKLQDNLNKRSPHSAAYINLLNTLLRNLDIPANQDTVRQIKNALSNYRWIFHFHLPKYIVVNIASATLKYFQADSLLLTMKVVTGKPSTPTPRFVAYCDKLILYPYWNVPQSIAIHELLPACKKAAGILEFLNMQVLDSKGNIIDPKGIDWKKITAKNMPYHFRQSTGCDNALGVIKFNLTDPFSVYLHDTNAKYAFDRSKRFLSHGCIRIEQPVALANFISEQTIDSTFLQKCIRNQKPVVQPIAAPVPVFVIYQTADANADGLYFYEDIYHLN